MPAMIFISVDLPAPFSPISAWTWPRFKRNDTSSSASTPGKDLRTLATSSRYLAPGTAPLCRTISAVDGLMVAMALRPLMIAQISASDSYHKPRRNAGGGRKATASGISPQPSRRGGKARARSVRGSVLLYELIHIGWGHELEGNVDLLVD